MSEVTDMAEFDDLSRSGELRAALDRALRKLDKANVKKQELVEAVYQAAKDAAATMVVPPIPKPKAEKRSTSPEAAVCLLSDWQLGKVTPEYNSEICDERVRRYADKVVRLIGLQRAHHSITEAHIFLLGDLVEGELVFPGQAHRIDASLYRQMFHCSELIGHVVRRIASTVEKVYVVGVIGNHGELGGRSRRDYHPETNADAMAYNVARLQCVDEPRISWEETYFAGERAALAFHEVMGRRWLLFHGNQAAGRFGQTSFGIPWYGFGRRLQGYYMSKGAYDYAATGHFHQSIREQVNSITHWGAGSTESANTYAQEYLASGGQEPSQWLLFQGEEGVTAEWNVRVAA